MSEVPLYERPLRRLMAQKLRVLARHPALHLERLQPHESTQANRINPFKKSLYSFKKVYSVCLGGLVWRESCCTIIAPVYWLNPTVLNIKSYSLNPTVLNNYPVWGVCETCRRAGGTEAVLRVLARRLSLRRAGGGGGFGYMRKRAAHRQKSRVERPKVKVELPLT